MEKTLKKPKPQKSSGKKQKASAESINKKLLLIDPNSNIPVNEVLKLESEDEKIKRPLEKLTQMVKITLQTIKSASDPNEEKCPICLCEFGEEDSIIKLQNCEGHYFHLDCIEMCHIRAHLRCPICGVIYGIMTGDMPSGSMQVKSYSFTEVSLEGYPNTPVLEIIYNMHAGKRENISYPATKRHAFLPFNDEGKEILRLLLLAFERRLTFTIGTSVTTGRPNQIIWNGVHHKTAVGGGPACFGYPDDTYFFRVKEELAAKGIF